MIIGPLVAWISSWMLYAFGELVEKTIDNENNTRNILNKMNQMPIVAPYNYPVEKRYNNQIPQEQAPTMVCAQCNYEQPIGRKTCWHCGTSFESNAPTTHKWHCASCNNMRTQTPCEYCGNQ